MRGLLGVSVGYLVPHSVGRQRCYRGSVDINGYQLVGLWNTP
jgi:hypothetical protein